MRELSARHVWAALVIAMAVSERRSRRTRRGTPQPGDFIDEFVDMFEREELSPKVRRFRPGGIDPDDKAWREMLALIRQYASETAPLARLLADEEDEPVTHAPPQD